MWNIFSFLGLSIGPTGLRHVFLHDYGFSGHRKTKTGRNASSSFVLHVPSWWQQFGFDREIEEIEQRRETASDQAALRDSSQSS
jgi:hypothetical protein